MKLFVPKNFNIPKGFKTKRFYIRMLTINDLQKDYDAVISSIKYLQKTKPFGQKHKWPSKDITLEQDLIDLGWHQKEFQNRTSFAYTVFSLDETECLGCVYIYPSDNIKYDAKVMMWIRENYSKTDLDKYLFENIKKWLKESWPFKNPGYPGRSISWQSWYVGK